jgi:O-antigen/teichoic acid export membrane protein
MLFLPNLKTRLQHIFSGEERNKKVLINVFSSIFVKALSVITSLLLIPISLQYVDKEIYGLWLTIVSILTFMTLFDFGLTNGLRNSVIEANAKQDFKLIRTQVTTIYAIFFMTIAPVCLLFLAVSGYINWQSLFNTNVDKELLATAMKCIFVGFGLQFILQPITALLIATYKDYLSSLIFLIGNVVSLVLIIFLGRYFSSPFLFLSIVFSFTPAVILLIFSFFLYRGIYSAYSPNFKFIAFKKVKNLFRLSFRFFIIQFAGLLMYSSNYIIISQFIGNAAVTTYNIVFRLFGIILTFQSLVIAPLWTGYGDAYIKKDFDWIRSVIKKVNLFSWVLCGVLVVMVMLSGYIYRLWIGNDFTAPLLLNVLMAINIGITLFGANYTVFVNGTGKVRLQMYKSVLSGLLHFPLAYLLVKKMKLGVDGLVVLNIFWMIISLVLWRYQYKKLLLDVPSRLWNV